MIQEEAQVTAILPWWRRRGWCPQVLQLLVDLPVLLPEVNDLFLRPDGVPCPDLNASPSHLDTLEDLSTGMAF